MDRVILIPARMGASRFPGKPLVNLEGKPMVQWVYEACLASGWTDSIYIATPDREIVEATESFGGRAILTSHDHPTGTDRLAEANEQLGASAVVNVQGDEPLIAPESIRAVGDALLGEGVELSSAYCQAQPEEYDLPQVVKVVLNHQADSLYFSRYPIPFARENRVLPVYKHLGLYGYRQEPLRAYSSWEPGPLEVAEGLEQLRFLHHGFTFRMVEVEPAATAVDVPEQAEQVRQILQNRTT